MKRGRELLALLLVLLLFGGCTVPEPAATEPRQVLRLMTLNTVRDYMEEMVDSFNRDNPYGVTLELETMDMETYKQMLPLDAAGGDLPDIFFTWEAGYLEPYVRSGNVLPLTSYLEDWDDEFEPGVFEPLRFDGEIYAVPLQQSLTVVFYNKAVFQEAEATPPETWEEFLSLCESLKARGIAPLAVGSQDWMSGQLLTAILAGVGGRELCESLAGGGRWQEAEMIRSVELLQELYDRGYAVRTGASVYEGTAAMLLSGDWFQANYWENENMGAFLLPSVEPFNQGVCIRSVDQCYALSAGCKNPEAACGFLQYLTDRENQLRLWQRTGQSCSTKVTGTDVPYNLQQEILELYRQVEDSVIWIDRGIGGDVGTAFNQMATAILSGRDAHTELEQFRKTLETLYGSP